MTGDGVWTNDEDLRLIAVEFQKINLHPSFKVAKGGSEGGVDGRGDGFGGEVELGVVSIAKEAEAAALKDFTKGKNVQDEEERA